MSTLNVNTIRSQATTAPVIQNSSGTEVGQFVKAFVHYNPGKNLKKKLMHTIKTLKRSLKNMMILLIHG